MPLLVLKSSDLAASAPPRRDAVVEETVAVREVLILLVVIGAASAVGVPVGGERKLTPIASVACQTIVQWDGCMWILRTHTKCTCCWGSCFSSS